MSVRELLKHAVILLQESESVLACKITSVDAQLDSVTTLHCVVIDSWNPRQKNLASASFKSISIVGS